MALSASGSLSVTFEALEINTASGAAAVNAALQHTISVASKFDAGTSDGQINRVYSATYSVDATGTAIDLAGSIASALSGGTVTFAEIQGLIVTADAANGGDTYVGNAASNQWFGFAGASGHYVVVQPGGAFVWLAKSAGSTVTAATGDQLLLKSSTGTVTGKILLIGRNA